MTETHAGATGTDGPGDRALVDSLAGIEIPPRPAILDQVMAELHADEPDYRHLATLITSDMGLSAWMIKTANSAVFGYRTKARTVRDALTMLGLLMVLRTVAGFSLRQTLPESPALAGFWDRAARTAHLSAWLARELGIRDGVRPQEAYTFSLFRDCGIPVLMRVNAGYEAALTAARHEHSRAFTDIEAEHLGLNHAQVGSAMARSWYLPEEHCDGILRHHDAAAVGDARSGLSATSRRFIAIAQLADHLQDGPQPVDCEWGKLGQVCLHVLDIDETRIDALRSDARRTLDDLD